MAGGGAMKKVYQLVDMKLDSDGEGTFEAVFIGDMAAVDRDGDSYDPGAIGEQEVVISQWNHGSWGQGADALPIGVGEIFERGSSPRKAIVRGEFDREDDAAARTYRKLKYLVGKGRNVEWSYALPDVDYRFEEREGRDVRVFTRISVPEVSPVLMGAGVDTELLSIKRLDGGDGKTEDNRVEESTSSKRLIDHVNEVAEAVEKVTDRICQLKAERDTEGGKIARRSERMIEMLKEIMADAVKQIDDAMSQESPAMELRALASKWEGGHAESE